MKKKAIRPEIYRHEEGPDIKTLTPRDVLKRGASRCSCKVYGTKDDFVCYHTGYAATCIAGRIFWKRTCEFHITFKDGKIYGNIVPVIEDVLIKAFNLNWIENKYGPWIRALLRGNKTLWRMILQGKITNPEQLAKRYSKMYFKGAYSYRVLREYFSNYSPASLWDIYYYTTNPELFLERILRKEVYPEWSRLAKDTIEYCKYDNTKLNPLWSMRRLREFHQHQIEMDVAYTAKEISAEIIAPPVDIGPMHLILSEKDCYIEGCTMSNCVHSCYWSQVKDGHYILVKGDIDNTHFDLGIRVSGDKLTIDQVYKAYNIGVPSEIEEYCKLWVDNNKEKLLETVNYIRNQKSLNV